MKPSLPDSCERVRGHLNAYLSGEVSELIRDDVTFHLTTCEQCSAEFQTRQRLKELLKGAVQRRPLPPFLDARIRGSLTNKKTAPGSITSWVPAFGLAAATLLALLAGWIASRLDRPSEMAKADQDGFIETIYGEVVAIMRVGLGDHLHCAYFRQFPNKPPTAEELVSKIGPQYAPLLPVIREHAPAGHRVLLAHQCVYEDRSFIHVALADRGKLVSLVITRKQPGESFRQGGAQPVAEGPGPTIYHATAKQFEVAAFEAADYLAFIVSDHSDEYVLQLAANLALPVQEILAGRQG